MNSHIINVELVHKSITYTFQTTLYVKVWDSPANEGGIIHVHLIDNFTMTIPGTVSNCVNESNSLTVQADVSTFRTSSPIINSKIYAYIIPKISIADCYQVTSIFMSHLIFLLYINSYKRFTHTTVLHTPPTKMNTTSSFLTTTLTISSCPTSTVTISSFPASMVTSVQALLPWLPAVHALFHGCQQSVSCGNRKCFRYDS